MSEQMDPWREELGAYLVGALEADEAERVRQHLDQCEACRAEYAQLAPVVNLMAKIPAEAFAAGPTGGARDASGAAQAGPLDVAPDPAMWERLRARAGLPAAAESASDVRFLQAPGAPKPNVSGRPPRPHARQTRPGGGNRRPLRPATAALISGVLVAVAAFGIYEGTRPSPGPAEAATETVTASNAADGVTGTVQYRPTDWGSWVQITLKGVKPGDACVLYAEDNHGDKSVASSWWAPPLLGESATIPGGVNMRSSSITNFQVTTTVGEVLLNIPAS